LIVHRSRSDANRGLPSRAADLLVRLRLHRQLLLAPIFILGYALAGGRITARGGLAFAIVHVCLYGGAAAFQSHFDRATRAAADPESPSHRTQPELVPFSVGLMIAGLVLAVFLGIDFWAICAAITVLSIGYAHPLVRWKARPWGSLLVIGIGRGMLGFDLGVLASGTGASYLRTADLFLGACAATLFAAGLHLRAMIRRMDDDRARGDRTFAVVFGGRTCLRLSSAMFVVSAIGLIVALVRHFGRGV